MFAGFAKGHPMLRVITFPVFGPYWLHLLVAAGLAVGGYFVQDYERTRDEVRLAIAAQQQPEALPIEKFVSANGDWHPEEVHLRAQWVLGDSIRLAEDAKAGKVKWKYRLHLLYATDADAKAMQAGLEAPMRAYAGIVVPMAQEGQFEEWVAGQLVPGAATGSAGPVFEIAGFRGDVPGGDMARKGMEKYSLPLAPGFFFIAPFYDGRAAGVAYAPQPLAENAIAYYYPAIALLLTGLVKLLWALMIGKKPKARAASPVFIPVAAKPDAELVPQMAPVAAPTLKCHDYIGALGARHAETAATASQGMQKRKPAAQDAAVVLIQEGGGRLRGSLARMMRKVWAVAAALVLYLLVMDFGGLHGLQTWVVSFSSRGGEVVASASVATVAPVVQTRESPVMEGPMAGTAVEESAALVQGHPMVFLDYAKERLSGLAKAAKAKAGLWMAETLLWSIWAVLACFIFVPALILLRKRWPERGKAQGFDPFERLLQRRLAERARAERAAMGAMGVQQA
jgi:hypothetical protein